MFHEVTLSAMRYQALKEFRAAISVASATYGAVAASGVSNIDFALLTGDPRIIKTGVNGVLDSVRSAAVELYNQAGKSFDDAIKNELAEIGDWSDDWQGKPCRVVFGTDEEPGVLLVNDKFAGRFRRFGDIALDVVEVYMNDGKVLAAPESKIYDVVEAYIRSRPAKRETVQPVSVPLYYLVCADGEPGEAWDFVDFILADNGGSYPRSGLSNVTMYDVVVTPPGVLSVPALHIGLCVNEWDHTGSTLAWYDKYTVRLAGVSRVFTGDSERDTEKEIYEYLLAVAKARGDSPTAPAVADDMEPEETTNNE